MRNRPQRLKTKTRETMVLGGRELPYTLTVSRLARGVRLKISPQTGLEVVVPHRFSLTRLPRLLHEKEHWITGHLSRLTEQKKQADARLTDGATLNLFGEPYTLRFMPTIKKKPAIREARTLRFASDRAEFSGREIIVYTRAGSDSTAAVASAKKELEAFFRKKAQQYFTRRVPEIAAVMGTRFIRITVRGQQSRWGSCSRQNNLNFNWRLIFYEKAVADYVIFHELAHTVHHNHSQRFYALLERFCPDYKRLRKILRGGQALI